LLYLSGGFGIGAVLLIQKGLSIDSRLWWLLPLHTEFLLFGWFVQLAMGVAFWILPRFRTPPVRGREGLGWLAFVLLNAGVILAGLRALPGTAAAVPLAGRAAEAAAALAFAAHAWPRIKPMGD
jgi:cbb3-type cytochrome oxidase subunit 1